LTNPLKSGKFLYSSMLPQGGAIASQLLLSPVSGDVVEINGTTTSFTFNGTSWSPAEPSIKVGEAFWLTTSTARNWTRTLSTCYGTVTKNVYSVQFAAPGADTKTGIAAVGISSSDFWNVFNLTYDNEEPPGTEPPGQVSVYDTAHTAPPSMLIDLLRHDGDWPASGTASVADDPLLNSFIWPPGGGSFDLYIWGLAPGSYDLYFFGSGYPFGGGQRWNATFDMISGFTSLASTTPQSTSSSAAFDIDVWREGNQYVVFRSVQAVGPTTAVKVNVTGPFSEALLNGLQIVRRAYKVTALTATAGYNQITLNWQAAPGATYTVKRGTSTGGPYTIIASGVTGTSYVDSGLPANSTFFYVVATDTACAVTSAEASATTFRKFINVQFCVDGATPKTGIAAVGASASDYWNVLTLVDAKDFESPPPGTEPSAEGPGYDNAHNSPPAAGVEVFRHDGDWPCGGSGSIATDPLLNSYFYPPGGGSIDIVVFGLSGPHDIYLYGIGPEIGGGARWNATFEITSGASSVGPANPQSTWSNPGNINIWTEGRQYVLFNVTPVNSSTPIVINVTGYLSEALISGMQITPSP
jgi:hypothetical protein